MKKGFTLIELLAVIVILAIIALIATPIVLNIINDTKESAVLRSADFYINALENEIALENMKLGGNLNPKECIIGSDGNATCDEVLLEIEVDGEKPNSGSIKYDNGKVIDVILTFGDKTISMNSKGELILGEVQKACYLSKDEDSDGVASLSDVITCGTENFYVMKNENSEITMLSMYNLYVGDSCVDEWTCTPLENPTNRQSELAKGRKTTTWYGTIDFSDNTYWSTYDGKGNVSLLQQYGTEFPVYIYDENSYLYQYVNEYERILKEDLGVSSAKSMLISYEQLEDLNCSYDLEDEYFDCSTAPSWVFSTSYWTGSASTEVFIWYVDANNDVYYFGDHIYPDGIRPVISISVNEI